MRKNYFSEGIIVRYQGDEKVLVIIKMRNSSYIFTSILEFFFGFCIVYGISVDISVWGGIFLGILGFSVILMQVVYNIKIRIDYVNRTFVKVQRFGISNINTWNVKVGDKAYFEVLDCGNRYDTNIPEYKLFYVYGEKKIELFQFTDERFLTDIKTFSNEEIKIIN